MWPRVEEVWPAIRRLENASKSTQSASVSTADVPPFQWFSAVDFYHALLR
jgi:hypothetical protein